MDWNEIRDEAHDVAKEKGWWDDDRHIIIPTSLVHTEITEAHDAWENGGQNLGEELSDICLRISDLFGRYDHDLQHHMESTNLSSFNCNPTSQEFCYQWFNQMHRHTSFAMEVAREIHDGNEVALFSNLGIVVMHVVYFSRFQYINIKESIQKKMIKNKGREYRHGGKEF